MTPEKEISNSTTTNRSRRRFLANSLKLATAGALLLPLQKAFGKGSDFIISNSKKLAGTIRKVVFSDNLILNKKTNIVHLPTEKIFTHYPDIAAENQKIIDLRTWETQAKKPVHFNKEKSGIILELLALQKLAIRINDHNLTAAINTLAIAFTDTYKTKNGDIINKYNFRLHNLLLQTIALNGSIPDAQKWNKFQLCTGKIHYSTSDDLSKRMKWIMTKPDFDKQITYVLNNRTQYTDQLKKRASTYKL